MRRHNRLEAITLIGIVVGGRWAEVNYPRGKLLGCIYLGAIFLGGNWPGVNCMGGDNCLGDNCSRWELSGGIFRGGNCPRLSQVAVVWWAIDRGALDNCPHPPRQLSPVQLPSRQFPLRTIVPRQLPSREFLLRNIAPRLRTGQFPPI